MHASVKYSFICSNFRETHVEIINIHHFIRQCIRLSCVLPPVIIARLMCLTFGRNVSVNGARKWMLAYLLRGRVLPCIYGWGENARDCSSHLHFSHFSLLCKVSRNVRYRHSEHIFEWIDQFDGMNHMQNGSIESVCVIEIHSNSDENNLTCKRCWLSRVEQTLYSNRPYSFVVGWKTYCWSIVLNLIENRNWKDVFVVAVDNYYYMK